MVVVGPLPPPTHGAANVTLAVYERLLSSGADIVAVDTNVEPAENAARYLYTRAMRHARAVAVLVRNRGHSTRSLYMGGAGGRGLWYQVITIVFAIPLGYRVVFHHHSFAYLDQRAAAMSALCRVGKGRIDHVVLCRGMSTRLQKLYPRATNIRICSNAAWLDKKPSSASSRDHHGMEVGHISGLSVEKGLLEMLETLREARKVGFSMRLHLAGSPRSLADEAILEQAKREFEDDIVVHGFLDRGRVDALLSSLDAFLFPSLYSHEAEPLAVLEALKAGVPVLAYDVGCLGAIVGAADLVAPTRSFAAPAVQWLVELSSSVGRAQRTKSAFEDLALGAQAAASALITELIGTDTGPVQLADCIP